MLAHLLNRMRKRVGLTIRAVHLRTGIPISTLYDHERGTHVPSPKRLGELLDVYDATPGERFDALVCLTRPREPRTDSAELSA